MRVMPQWIRIENFKTYNNPRPGVKYTSWVRLQNNFLTDPIFAGLEPSERLLWVYFITQASEQMRPIICINMKSASQVCGCTLAKANNALEYFASFGLLTSISAEDAKVSLGGDTGTTDSEDDDREPSDDTEDQGKDQVKSNPRRKAAQDQRRPRTVAAQVAHKDCAETVPLTETVTETETVTVTETNNPELLLPLNPPQPVEVDNSLVLDAGEEVSSPPCSDQEEEEVEKFIGCTFEETELIQEWTEAIGPVTRSAREQFIAEYRSNLAFGPSQFRECLELITNHPVLKRDTTSIMRVFHAPRMRNVAREVNQKWLANFYHLSRTGLQEDAIVAAFMTSLGLKSDTEEKMVRKHISSLLRQQERVA